MAEPSSPNSTASDPKRVPPDGAGAVVSGKPVRLILWVVLSIAFLGYLAFGTVGARIWRFGQLQIESRSIASTWRVQGRNLPDVSHQWLIESVFYGAIGVFVVCTIVGMRLLLAECTDDRARVGNDHS